MIPNPIDAAKANLASALREEGEALAEACEVVNTSGAGSEQGAKALRAVQLAHARSGTAISALRALNAQADRADAALGSV